MRHTNNCSLKKKKRLRHILTTTTALGDTEEQNRTMSGYTFSSQTFQQLIILKRKVLTFFFLQTIVRVNEVFNSMTLFCSSSQANLKKPTFYAFQNVALRFGQLRC